MQFVKDGEQCGEAACFTNSVAGRNWTLGFPGFASAGCHGYVITSRKGLLAFPQARAFERPQMRRVPVRVPGAPLCAVAVSPRYVVVRCS